MGKFLLTGFILAVAALPAASGVSGQVAGSGILLPQYDSTLIVAADSVPEAAMANDTVPAEATTVPVADTVASDSPKVSEDQNTDFRPWLTVLNQDQQSQTEGTNGKVKSIIAQKFSGPAKDSLESTFLISFDLKGNIVGETFVKGRQTTIRESKIEYGAGWTVSEIMRKSTRIENTDSLIARKIENFSYKYDGVGRLRSAELRNGLDSLIWSKSMTRDGKGNLTEEDVKDGNGSLTEFSTYRYLGAKPYESDNYIISKGDTVLRKKFQYGRNGKVVRESYYAKSGEPKWSHVYDTDGNLTATTVYGDSLLTARKYTYELDSLGSWTTKKEYANGRIIAITIRTIEYYADVSGDMKVDRSDSMNSEAVKEEKESISDVNVETAPPEDIRKKIERRQR